MICEPATCNPAVKSVISIEKIILVTTLLIVFILLPAVIILAYVAGGSESVPEGQKTMPLTLAGSQIALFVAATMAYFALGGWGMYLQNKYTHPK